MIANLLITYGLGAGWLIWLFMPMPGAARLAGAAALTTATSAVVWRVRLRARRLRSPHEGIPGRLIVHAGLGGSRWDRGDDEGLESSVGGGW